MEPYDINDTVARIHFFYKIWMVLMRSVFDIELNKIPLVD